MERLPNTVLLASCGVLFSVIVGIPIGIIAARKQYSIFDNVSMVFSLIGASAPAFWIGLLLVLIFSLNLKIFPASGMGKGICKCSKVTGASGYYHWNERCRNNCKNHPFFYAGKQSGKIILIQPVQKVPVKLPHIPSYVKNALIPVITAVGLNFGVLLGGSVLTETVFAWPGIGRFVIESIKTQDIPVFWDV